MEDAGAADEADEDAAAVAAATTCDGVIVDAGGGTVGGRGRGIVDADGLADGSALGPTSGGLGAEPWS
jgi:hypothetical protein